MGCILLSLDVILLLCHPRGVQTGLKYVSLELATRSQLQPRQHMSLKFTTAPTSRISKSSSRQSSSPLKSSSKGSLSASRRSSKHGGAQPRLPDTGRIVTVLRKPAKTVDEAMYLGLQGMFDPIPSSGIYAPRMAEINSERTALAPVVTISHIHALMGNAGTRTERELASLTSKGELRRVVVPSRGMTGGGEEVVIRKADLERLVGAVGDLADDAREDFLTYLRENPLARTIPRTRLPADGNVALIRAGFLSIPHADAIAPPVDNTYKSADAATNASLLATSIAAPAGSLAAAGGAFPVYNLGGSGGGIKTQNSTSPEKTDNTAEEVYQLTLPGMGPFLRILIESRNHMVSLLGRSHGGEVPQSLLEERWDGGIITHGRSGLKAPPVGKTRKWKYFHGLRSQWVLAECVGAGMLELFDTGSVGNGVRSTGKRA